MERETWFHVGRHWLWRPLYTVKRQWICGFGKSKGWPRPLYTGDRYIQVNFTVNIRHGSREVVGWPWYTGPCYTGLPRAVPTNPSPTVTDMPINSGREEGVHSTAKRCYPKLPIDERVKRAFPQLKRHSKYKSVWLKRDALPHRSLLGVQRYRERKTGQPGTWRVFRQKGWDPSFVMCYVFIPDGPSRNATKPTLGKSLVSMRVRLNSI